ncbi:MAG TPA: amino acid racemase [Desulfotignum sp.]|nr:amino acid racemase [Desulfotignum sp.]
MTQTREKIVGIIGGMGPEATVDLMQRIIRLTPATDDKDHIRCIVDNNPKVPSRIRAIIEGDGEDPGPVMADMGRRLEAWGADFLVIPCNTAHYYYDAVQQAVNIPVVNMIDRVVEQVKTRFGKEKKIGMLASPAVAITQLYTRRFAALGMAEVWPDPEHQDLLFSIIRQVKTGRISPDLHQQYARVCGYLKDRDVQVAIVACTELSALGGNLPLATIDASQVLAEEIVRAVKHA